MAEKKVKEQRFLMIIITIILIFNTISIVGVYIIFNNRIDSFGSVLIQMAQQIATTESDSSKEKVELPISEYKPLGVFDAPVKLDIVTDIECPYCQKLDKMLFPALEDSYIKMGLVQLTYHALPLENIHSKAMPVAKALFCANLNDNFWQSYKYYTQNINTINVSEISYDDCSVNYDIETRIRENADSIKAAGITGTPALIMDGYRLKNIGSYDKIKSEIDATLKKISTTIEPESVNRLVKQEAYQLLDVRTTEEFLKGSIPESININILENSDFLSDIMQLDKNKGYIVFCKSGTRSSWAWNILKSAGFSDVVNLISGYDGWIRYKKEK